MDLFGNMSDPKVNKKFQIYRFTNGTKSKSPFQESRTGGSKVDDVMLERSLKDIESTNAKLLMEYDRIYKEMMIKRKQLSQDMAEMKGVAKGEVIAMFHKADIDLLNSAVSVINSKARVASDKVKSMLSERKFYLDKTKPVATAETTSSNQNANVGFGINSPLVVVNDKPTQASGNAYVVSGARPQASEKVVDVESMNFEKEDTGTVSLAMSPMEKYNLEQHATTEEAEKIPVETPLVRPADLNNYNDDTIVTRDATGVIYKTVTDVQNENLNKINERLKEGTEFKQDYNTRLGHDYTRSLQAVKQDVAKVEHHMFIDPDSGMYYMKGFTRDDSGNLTEYKEYDPMGLPHIGSIKFNGSKPECKIQFFQDAIPYHVAHGLSEMPEFYVKEWSKPNANQFVIENESDLMTIRKVSSENR